MIERKLAYLAGFFDGEGCVSVNKNGSISLVITNTSLVVLNEFKNVLGGTIFSRKQIVNKPQFVWAVYGDSAYKIAHIFSEYCIEKKPEIDIVIGWFNIRDQYKPTRNTMRGSTAHPERANAIKETQQLLTKMKKGLHESAATDS